MLTDQELQSLRNTGNESEEAADEITRLRADLEHEQIANARAFSSMAEAIRNLRADLAAKTEECERLLAANKDCMAHFDQMRSDLAASQAECEQLRADAERLDDLESLVREQNSRGVSFDYVKFVEEGVVVEKGFRIMWLHNLGDRQPSLRAAIDAARAGKGGQS